MSEGNGTAPVRGLHAKLAEVMAEVERIPKRGRAPEKMGGFEFVQVGDAADAIRKALGSRKVSMLPSTVEILSETEHETKSGGTMTTQSIRTTWTLVDGETGESAAIQSLGTGADTGDKFSPKAQSNAMKYALLMGFLLSTGEDPELSDSSDRRARRPDREAATDAVRDRIIGGQPAFTSAAAFDAGLIGTAQVGKGDADFELRQTADKGPRIAFRLVEGRQGLKVETFGPLAELIAQNRVAIEGQRVTCWGALRPESFTPAGTKKEITYNVLALARIKAGALDLTAPEPDDEPDGLTGEEREMADLAFPVTA